MLIKLSSLGLSIIVSFGLLMLMAFKTKTEEKPNEELLTFRDVKLKPPVVTKQMPKSSVLKNELNLEAINISESPIHLVLELEPVETSLKLDLKTGDDHVLDISFDQELKVSLSEDTIFSFEELNYNPTLLHTGGFKFSFPRELARRGIKQGVVNLRIEIDEKGEAKVLEVVSSSHTLLVPLAKDLVGRSRYTIPKNNGEAVSSVGIVPVTFKAN